MEILLAVISYIVLTFLVIWSYKLYFNEEYKEFSYIIYSWLIVWVGVTINLTYGSTKHLSVYPILKNSAELVFYISAVLLLTFMVQGCLKNKQHYILYFIVASYIYCATLFIR